MRLFKIILIYFALLFAIPSFSDELIIEPDMGRESLLNFIQQAKSLQLVMYGFTDKKLIQALISHKNNFQIILEKSPYKADDENAYAIQQFEAKQIPLHWPNPAFALTHQKTFIFDHHNALIMTFNLTYSTFTNERNFALWVDNPDEVTEIANVFHADWEHQSSKVNNPNLLWCPDNCRNKLLTFIQSARHTIKIYAQDISDYQITGVLASAARKGVDVQLLLSASNDSIKNQKRFDYLRRAGATIHFNKEYIIHAKVIIIDQQRAVLGSINLTESSLNDNRELSIITSDKKVIEKLLTTFTRDWNN